jgi:hypothetical protein
MYSVKLELCHKYRLPIWKKLTVLFIETLFVGKKVSEFQIFFNAIRKCRKGNLQNEMSCIFSAALGISFSSSFYLDKAAAKKCDVGKI